MSESPLDRLPDRSVIESTARSLAAAAPDGWTDIQYVMWYPDERSIASRMWVLTPDGRARVQPPDVEMPLHAMRAAQAAAGQPPWLRLDMWVSRQPGGNAELHVDFGYTADGIPE